MGDQCCIGGLLLQGCECLNGWMVTPLDSQTVIMRVLYIHVDSYL